MIPALKDKFKEHYQIPQEEYAHIPITLDQYQIICEEALYSDNPSEVLTEKFRTEGITSKQLQKVYRTFTEDARQHQGNIAIEEAIQDYKKHTQNDYEIKTMRLCFVGLTMAHDQQTTVHFDIDGIDSDPKNRASFTSHELSFANKHLTSSPTFQKYHSGDDNYKQMFTPAGSPQGRRYAGARTVGAPKHRRERRKKLIENRKESSIAGPNTAATLFGRNCSTKQREKNNSRIHTLLGNLQVRVVQ